MATPLSDEIRALITFANETTEAGDTKLGDCVKTLCEGYNGGKNVPSSPLVVPQGAISSRLAALLAYANETTGAGDTTMGDAIRTLCEGYGGGEVVFYESIATDRTAYIDTGVLANGVLSSMVSFRWMGPGSSPDTVILGARKDSGNTRYFLSALYVNSLAFGTGSYNPITEKIGASMRTHYLVSQFTTIRSGNSKSYFTVQESGYNSEVTKSSDTVTDTNKSLYLFRNNYSTPSSCNSYMSIHEVKIWDDDTMTNLILHLVPCTYNGEAGMWDLVSQTFFGNAASSGQFTVEGEIVYYDKLVGDGVAYIDTDIPYDPTTRILIDFDNSSNKSWYNIMGVNDTWSRQTYFTITSNAYKYIQVRIATQGDHNAAKVYDDTTFVAGKRHKLNVDLALKEAYFDGHEPVGVNGDSIHPTTGNWRLFGTKGSYSNQISNYSMYGFSVYSNDGSLMYNLVPCTFDSTPGMYDTINRKFYGNSNTSGAFTVENES